MPGTSSRSSESMDQQVLLQGHKPPATYPKWRQMENVSSQQQKQHNSPPSVETGTNRGVRVGEKAAKFGGSGAKSKAAEFSKFRQNELANAGGHLPKLTAVLDLDAVPASGTVHKDASKGNTVLQAPMSFEETPQELIEQFMKQKQQKERALSPTPNMNSVLIRAPINLDESPEKMIADFMRKKKNAARKAAQSVTRSPESAAGERDESVSGDPLVQRETRQQLDDRAASKAPTQNSSVVSRGRIETVGTSPAPSNRPLASPPAAPSGPPEKPKGKVVSSLGRVHTHAQTSPIVDAKGTRQSTTNEDDGDRPWWLKWDAGTSAANTSRSGESGRSRSRSPVALGEAPKPARSRSRSKSPEVSPGISPVNRNSKAAAQYQGSKPFLGSPSEGGSAPGRNVPPASDTSSAATAQSTTKMPQTQARAAFSPTKQQAQTLQSPLNTPSHAQQPSASSSNAQAAFAKAASSPGGDDSQSEFAIAGASLRRVLPKPSAESTEGQIQAHKPELSGEKSSPQVIGKQVRPTVASSTIPPEVVGKQVRPTDATSKTPLQMVGKQVRLTDDSSKPVTSNKLTSLPSSSSQAQGPQLMLASSSARQAYKVVKVTVQRALHLPKVDTFGSIDPYCELHVGSNVEKTEVIKNNYAPVWNQNFTFDYLTAGDSMVLKLYDWDRFSKNDLVGEVVVPLNGQDVEQAFTLMLQGAVVKGKDKENAQVFMRLEYAGETCSKQAVGRPDEAPAFHQDYQAPQASRHDQPSKSTNQHQATRVELPVRAETNAIKLPDNDTSKVRVPFAQKDRMQNEKEQNSKNNTDVYGGSESGEKIMSVAERLKQLAGGGMKVERGQSFKRSSMSPGARSPGRRQEQRSLLVYANDHDIASQADDAQAQHLLSISSSSVEHQFNIHSTSILPVVDSRATDAADATGTLSASSPPKSMERTEVAQTQPAESADGREPAIAAVTSKDLTRIKNQALVVDQAQVVNQMHVKVRDVDSTGNDELVGESAIQTEQHSCPMASPLTLMNVPVLARDDHPTESTLKDSMVFSGDQDQTHDSDLAQTIVAMPEPSTSRISPSRSPPQASAQAQYSISPASVQHQSSISPISAEHQSSISQTSVQHQSSICPASVQHQSSIGQASVQHQSNIGPTSVQHQSSIGSASAQYQIHGGKSLSRVEDVPAVDFPKLPRADSEHSVLSRSTRADSGLSPLPSPSHGKPADSEDSNSVRPLLSPMSRSSLGESLHVAQIEHSPQYAASTIDPSRLSSARAQQHDSARHEESRVPNFTEIEHDRFPPSLVLSSESGSPLGLDRGRYSPSRTLSDPGTPLGLVEGYKDVPFARKEDNCLVQNKVSPPFGLVLEEHADAVGGITLDERLFVPVEDRMGGMVTGDWSLGSSPISMWEKDNGKVKGRRSIELHGVEEEQIDSINESNQSHVHSHEGEGSDDDARTESVISDHANAHLRIPKVPLGGTNTGSAVVSLGPLTVEIDATVGVTDLPTRTDPRSSRKLSQTLLHGNTKSTDSGLYIQMDRNTLDSPDRPPRVDHPSSAGVTKETLVAHISLLEKQVISLSAQVKSKDSMIAENVRKIAALSAQVKSQRQLVEERDTRVADLIDALAKVQHEWQDELALQKKEHQHAMSQALHEHTEELTKLQKLSADEITKTLSELVVARDLEAQATRMAAEYANEVSCSLERSAMLERCVEQSRQSMQAQMYAAQQSEMALRMKLVEVEDTVMRARQEATRAQTEFDQSVAASVERQLIAAQLEDALQDELVELRKEAAALRASRDSLSTDVKYYSSAMESLREEVDKLEKEVKQARMDSAAAKETIGIMEKRHNNDMIKRNMTLDEAMRENAAKKKELFEARQREESVRREAAEIKSKLLQEGKLAERECERACVAEKRLRGAVDAVTSRGSEVSSLAELCAEDIGELRRGMKEMEFDRERACKRWRAEMERAEQAEAKAAELELVTAGILEDCVKGLGDSRACARDCENTLLEMQKLEQLNSEQAMQERLEKEALQSRVKALEHYLDSIGRQPLIRPSSSIPQQESSLLARQELSDQTLPGARALDTIGDDLESISSLNSLISISCDESEKMLQFLESGRKMLAKFVWSARELDSANAGLQHKVGRLAAQLERMDTQRREGNALNLALQTTKAFLSGAAASDAVASLGTLALKSANLTDELQGKNVVWLTTALHTTQAALHKEQIRCVELEGRVAVLTGEKGALELQVKVTEKLLAGLAARDGLGAYGEMVQQESKEAVRGEQALLDGLEWRDEKLRALQVETSRLMEALKSAQDERDGAEARVKQLQAVLAQQDDMEVRLKELEQESKRLRKDKEELESSIIKAHQRGADTTLNASETNFDDNLTKRNTSLQFTQQPAAVQYRSELIRTSVQGMGSAPMSNDMTNTVSKTSTPEIPLKLTGTSYVEVGSEQRGNASRAPTDLEDDGLSDAARRAREIRNSLKLLNSPSSGVSSPSSLRERPSVTAMRVSEQKRGANEDF